jgi:hypothetical protein
VLALVVDRAMHLATAGFKPWIPVCPDAVYDQLRLEALNGRT